MGKIEQIEAAVQALSADEQAAFDAWYLEFRAVRWDTQLERDARAGKLERLVQEASTEYTAGRAKPI